MKRKGKRKEKRERYGRSEGRKGKGEIEDLIEEGKREDVWR